MNESISSEIKAYYHQMQEIKEISVDSIMRESAHVLNIADRNLFPTDDALATAIAGHIMKKYDLRTRAGINLCQLWGKAFMKIPDAHKRPDLFAPGSKLIEQLKNVVKS